MKVLQVAGAYKPAYVYGGPTRSVTMLCESLAASGIAVTVLTTTANGKSELDVVPGKRLHLDNVTVTYYSRWTGDHTHLSPRLLLAVLFNCRKYHIVHVHSWWNLVSIPAVCICLLRGVRPVVSVRGTLSNHTFTHNHTGIKHWFHKMIGASLLMRCKLHATSQKEDDEIKKVVPNANTAVLPNILAMPPAIHERNASGDELKLLFVGRIHPIKNLEILFDALKCLNGQFKWKLSVIGWGELSYVEQLKGRTSGCSSIQWLGEADGREKYSQMANADVLVLLSHSENFGNVIIESLAQGTSVLVSRHVGMSGYVARKGFGWIIEPTVHDCREALIEIANNNTIRKFVRSAAPAMVNADFGSEVLADRYIKLYQDIINSRGNT